MAEEADTGREYYVLMPFHASFFRIADDTLADSTPQTRHAPQACCVFVRPESRSGARANEAVLLLLR